MCLPVLRVFRSRRVLGPAWRPNAAAAAGRTAQHTKTPAAGTQRAKPSAIMAPATTTNGVRITLQRQRQMTPVRLSSSEKMHEHAAAVKAIATAPRPSSVEGKGITHTEDSWES